MCGRFSQHREAEAYFAQLPANPLELTPSTQSYNVSPGSHPLIIQETEDGFIGTSARWGYQGRAPRMYINARVETAARSAYWQRLWERGRILVPADGWFEWTGEKPERQPHFIQRDDGVALMLAAILGEDGFAVLTTSADAGLLDVHDRRPIALSREGALRWVAPDTSARAALEIVAQQTLPEGAFRWHPVTRAMGNSRYQREDAIEPLAEGGDPGTSTKK